MSPTKFHSHNILNGSRPSPLKINRASQLIHKQSSSSSLSNNNSSSTTASVLLAPSSVVAGTKQHMQKTNPVIIYTHSPKVIHTQARDFMALVQKLTGLSSSRNHDETAPAQIPAQQRQQSVVGVNNNKGSESKPGNNSDDNENSSDENCGCGGGGGAAGATYSPILKPPKNPYFGDIPLFTPTTTATSVDYFCSSKPVYRFSDSAAYNNASSPSIANSISPSVLEFMKGLPEC